MYLFRVIFFKRKRSISGTREDIGILYDNSKHIIRGCFVYFSRFWQEIKKMVENEKKNFF